MRRASSLLATLLVAVTVYSWRADDGVLGFTNDPDRVPPRYRDSAVELNLDLKDYPKLTVPDPPPGTEDARQRRLEELRRLNGWCARRFDRHGRLRCYY